MTGLWFEQLEPGLRVRHAITRTVTEADNVLFTTMTMNPQPLHGTTVANLGFTRVDFPAPVFAGDTIHVVTDVIEARLSRSRPGTGIVTFEHRGLNQRDETVCIAVRAAMMHCQPAGEGPAGP
jgi:acyl dehydratase